MNWLAGFLPSTVSLYQLQLGLTVLTRYPSRPHLYDPSLVATTRRCLEGEVGALL